MVMLVEKLDVAVGLAGSQAAGAVASACRLAFTVTSPVAWGGAREPGGGAGRSGREALDAEPLQVHQVAVAIDGELAGAGVEAGGLAVVVYGDDEGAAPP